MGNKLLVKNVMIATFFNDGYNAIKIHKGDILIKDGFIEKIDRQIEESCDCIDGAGKIAFPGLINGRSRSLVSRLSKGISEDINVTKYGNTPIYTRVNPFVNIALDVLDDDELKSIIELAIYEAINSGTTTLIEQCTGRELLIFSRLCEENNIRTLAAPMLMNRKSLPEADAWGDFDNELEPVDEDGLIDWNKRIVKEYGDSGLVQVAMGLGSADTISESMARKVAGVLRETEAHLLIPLNETSKEREVCMERYGCTPTEFLHRNHLLTRKTLVGGNLLTDKDDRKILRSTRCNAVSCQSQTMLDGEINPFIDFLYDDIQTIAGSGRCSVNMLEQLKFLAISGKLESSRRYQMRAQDAFYATTIGGGRTLEWKIGELEEGCKADLILVNLDNPSFHPYAMPINELVYNTGASDVSDVIIDGKLVKKDGQVLYMQKKEIIRRSEEAMTKVWQRARKTGAL